MQRPVQVTKYQIAWTPKNNAASTWRVGLCSDLFNILCSRSSSACGDNDGPFRPGADGWPHELRLRLDASARLLWPGCWKDFHVQKGGWRMTGEPLSIGKS